MSNPDDLLRRADVVAWLRAEAAKHDECAAVWSDHGVIWQKHKAAARALDDGAAALERGEGPKALGPVDAYGYNADGTVAYVVLGGASKVAARLARFDRGADSAEAYEDAAERVRQALGGG